MSNKQTTTDATLIETRIKLRRQMEQAIRCKGEIACECGSLLPVHCMYKCLYCGRWFCRICAHKHFGSVGGPVPKAEHEALESAQNASRSDAISDVALGRAIVSDLSRALDREVFNLLNQARESSVFGRVGGG